MSFKTTVVLLVVFVALGGYFYFFQSQQTPASSNAPVEPRITSVKTEDVVKFSVRQSDKVVTAVKDNNGTDWYLDGPQRQAIDMARFNGVVLLFSGPRAKRLVDPKPTDLSLFGLAKPKDEVNLELKDGSKVQVLLGDLSPDESYQYVKVSDDDAVYLVDRGVGDVVDNFVAQPPIPTPTPAPGGATPTPTK